MSADKTCKPNFSGLVSSYKLANGCVRLRPVRMLLSAQGVREEFEAESDSYKMKLQKGLKKRLILVLKWVSN